MTEEGDSFKSGNILDLRRGYAPKFAALMNQLIEETGTREIVDKFKHSPLTDPEIESLVDMEAKFLHQSQKIVGLEPIPEGTPYAEQTMARLRDALFDGVKEIQAKRFPGLPGTSPIHDK